MMGEKGGGKGDARNIVRVTGSRQKNCMLLQQTFGPGIENQ